MLQALGQSDEPLTNRELAARLAVDPGHLHFHVRMLHRAGLIERAEAAGREKPYRAVAKHLKVGSEIRATGGASELQAAQLRELQRGFETHAAQGEFRSAQVHTRLAPETVRDLLRASRRRADGARGRVASRCRRSRSPSTRRSSRARPTKRSRTSDAGRRARCRGAARAASSTSAVSATRASSRNSLARLEALDDRLDRLGVADDVVRRDVRERVGDVVREVVALAERVGDVACLGPAAEREQRERRGVAADRRLDRSAPSSSVQLRVAPRPPLVAGEQRRLQRADRASPRLAALPALAPARGRAAEPLGRLRVARHQQPEAGGVGRIPLADERPLVELAVLLGEARLALASEGNPIHLATLY